MFIYNIYTGPEDSFSGLTNEGKIAVASTVTAFVVGSVLFIVGFLCGHFCRREKNTTRTGTTSQPEKTQSASYYDDTALEQNEQELELKENVAYGPIL